MTTSRPDCTVFFLPGLGLDASSAAPIAAAVGPRLRVVGIDLLGQGSAADVERLADIALARITEESDGGPWMLCAHSLGGKVAARVMARVLAGSEPVFGLAGAVLLAPSPPSPEPMPEQQRRRMLEWARGDRISPEDAAAFLDDNSSRPLGRGAIDAVVGTPTSAWREWLESGSRQDVTAAVGVLDLPVVVLAGGDDENLGADAQPDLHEAVYPRARFDRLPGVGHLLPYEAPERVGGALDALWEEVGSRSPRVPAPWGAVIASSRVDPAVRRALALRALSDDSERMPRALDPDQLLTLRRLAGIFVPQEEPSIDLAARVDATLADGGGDGWRVTGLPADAEAYRSGLDAVAAAWPTDARQVGDFVAGLVEDGLSDPPWIREWLEDVRTDLVRAWLAHPASLARVGYDGFAVGGTGDEPAGWRLLGAGSREDWEPEELGR